MAIVFANAATAIELLVAGFIMIFFVQVAGNSMQIFASEVFPTNARASGFGWAAGVGRLATAFIMPTILWVQNGWGLTTVFVCLAILLLIAAVSVTQLGPRRGRRASTRSRRRRGSRRSSVMPERRRSIAPPIFASASPCHDGNQAAANSSRAFLHYRKLPQKRWMRVQASSSAVVAVA